jgi:hypothetical protein
LAVRPRESIGSPSARLEDITPKRVPSCSNAPILARRSIDEHERRLQRDGHEGIGRHPVHAARPRELWSTVTPVANIPSVRRNATAGSPSRPSPSSSASDAGATSYDAPNARRRDGARHRDLELGGFGLDASIREF